MTTFLIIYLSGVLTSLVTLICGAYLIYKSDKTWTDLTLQSIFNEFSGDVFKTMLILFAFSWFGFVITICVLITVLHDRGKDDPESLVYKILNYNIVKK